MNFTIRYYVDHTLRVMQAWQEDLFAKLDCIREAGGYDITIEVKP